ncbi:acetylneuraminic acid synthetase [candidate division KSB3 bacterium]|uniref:Acetylneuraminic acid synthetase n=1 Tax=candidate division KSB3 bacterium TaxID=2044937 RepID=A0A2G6EDW4_9BACT|nr:MAG: acetylneuraminic acid synthetase [candidate division KSB3 bacterium]
MIIEKNIARFIIFSEESIVAALKKISDNGSGLIFSVSDSGVLEGILSNGDFRRWLVMQDTIDLNQPVSNVSKKELIVAFEDEDPEQIRARFHHPIDYIPVLNSQHRIVAIARTRRSADGVQIGDFLIADRSPTVIIAEIGINHNGSLRLAKQLIEKAARAGADCAKFQMRDLQTLYRNAGNLNDANEDLGAQYTLDLLRRFQLSTEEMFEAFDYCKAQGLLPLCTPWDIKSLRVLEEYGMEAYKVASADLTNHDLLKAIAKSDRPLLCSTGMSTEDEIRETVKLLNNVGSKYVLLHCNSTYPAPFKDVNLRYLSRLKEIGQCPVGYSGHERGMYVAMAAVAKGAKVIEKHLTIDKTMEGNDHKVSLLPDEFADMVQGIRQIDQALGSAGKRRMSQGEMMNRTNLAKSVVASCDISVGDVIREEMLAIKSPGRGVQPNRKAELIGLQASRTIRAGDFFFPSDLVQDCVQPREYHFNRPWGLPVRYHDFKAILAKTNPDFLEFHLSYKDLDLDLHHFVEAEYELDMIVHSPDVFAGDHLLNLASEDEEHRQRSVRELQRVVDVTRALKPFFKHADRPRIVASLGGFTTDALLPSSAREELYGRIDQSLSELDAEGVEIIGQTLPPFPWYFGGQLYLNLFVEAADTVDFCNRYGYRLCFDVSHSRLACTHYQSSFKKYVEAVGPHSAHLHIADAKGVDGEGLQVNEGDIDFAALCEYLRKYAPEASFIPEIWQGHKNEGEGFWIALERLERHQF